MVLSPTSGFLLGIAVIIPVVIAERWTWEADWCRNYPLLLLEGDFNGDRRTDLLCQRHSDGYIWIAFADENGQFTGVGWYANLLWCYEADREFHIGDFNGDAKDDLLCHDTADGYIWIAHATSTGNFNLRTTWEADSGWCYHNGSELHIGDFDGDERDDLLCHDTYNGDKWIAHANYLGNFASGTTWEVELGRCAFNGADLHIGDFNGDSKDDMLCHNSNDGYLWVSYANCDGNFEDGADWEEGIGWCDHDGANMYIGDSNGDDKEDLFCHDPTSGYIWVSLATAESNFHPHVSWEASLKWCYGVDGRFLIGDFNGDAMADLMCHNYNNGYKYLVYATPPFE